MISVYNLLQTTLPNSISKNLLTHVNLYFSTIPTYLFLISSACFLFVILLIGLKIYFLYKSTKEKTVFLEITPPSNADQSSYSTEQLFTTVHSLGSQIPSYQGFLGKKKHYSLELVSTKNEGIRFLLRTNSDDAPVIERNISAYLPGVTIKKTTDYLPSKKDYFNQYGKIVELRLTRNFVLPLQTQSVLSEHDPIAYITSHMTKMLDEELISFQIILTPLINKTHQRQTQKIHEINEYLVKGLDISTKVRNTASSFPISVIFSTFKFGINSIVFCILSPFTLLSSFLYGGKSEMLPLWLFASTPPKKQTLSERQLNLNKIVGEKIGEELFETTIRIVLKQNTKATMQERLKGLLSTFSLFSNAEYQSLVARRSFPLISQVGFFQNISYFLLKNRLLSFSQNPILSVSELSAICHLPYFPTTKTEDVAKIHSVDLPAPLSLKNKIQLDVVFAENNYRGTVTKIGLTDKDRAKHMYLIGRTGSGKSTILFHMAKQDIIKGRGLCVIDPHGDLIEDLLTVIPEIRKDEFVYINPYDMKYPVRINLLELPEGLDEDELELEKEFVCESVIAIFRRVFSQDEKTDAHRIEYILRNTIYTAFTVKDRTIFTVFDLLNDPKLRTKVIGKLEDENLVNFWKNEYGIAGDYQVIKMVGGVTAKVGRFLFSPTAKRMLEETKSTINFDDVLKDGKILLCNLAEGKLSEDTSELIGTVIITKIHQAAMRRTRIKVQDRKPFYLYVDEFQNYATKSFTKLLSGGRKFGLRVAIAQQSTAQHDDRNMVNVILANVANIVCFQTASPIDEEMMWLQFTPYIEKAEIANLPQYRFYIKLSAITPEEPFSGQTLPIEINRDQKNIDMLIAASRKNYASEYKKPESKKEKKDKKIDPDANGGDKNGNVGSLL